MTTNKPEVLAWRWRKPIVNGQGETVGDSDWEYAATPDFLSWWTNDPLIRLSDYEALQAECEELRSDAARYRWLRDNDWRNDEEMEPVIRLHLNALWDEKIDAAMAVQAKQGGQPGWCDGCSPDNCCGCGPAAPAQVQPKQGNSYE